MLEIIYTVCMNFGMLPRHDLFLIVFSVNIAGTELYRRNVNMKVNPCPPPPVFSLRWLGKKAQRLVCIYADPLSRRNPWNIECNTFSQLNFKF